MQLPRISKTKFDSMTKAERRVMVAKDVLALIDLGALKTNLSGYLIIRGDVSKTVSTLLAQTNSCQICAIGAAYVASVLRFNQKIGNKSHMNTDGGEMCEEMSEIFTGKQLALMEEAYELDYYGDHLSGAYKFGNDHGNKEDRLIAIWQNVLDHNGTFAPSDRYVVTAS